LLNFRNLWNPKEPSVADIEKIRRTIKRIKGKVDVVRLGGMTDCFQPLEQTCRVTYETIKALNEYGIEYLIVTKSDMVATDEYMSILDKNLAHIQITVTTTDDDLSLTYEKAVVPSRRIKAIEKLQENGFDVALRLSPFIPEYIDFDVLNNIKCDKIQVEFLRVNSWIKKWFDIDYSNYTVKQSGYEHLPLELKKELIKKITGFKEVSVCEDESVAYEYWKDNFNPNKNDCCNLRR
jgi:DNA repair photolyase